MINHSRDPDTVLLTPVLPQFTEDSEPHFILPQAPSSLLYSRYFNKFMFYI